METNYLREAFQRLNLLEDDFNLSADSGVVDELRSFVADDIDAVAEEPIIDVEADNEDELKDSYIGKVILECDCCHARIYKDIADVMIDEETGLANVEERCPVCATDSGYTVIGKIEEFDKDKFENTDEEENSEDELDVEASDEESIEDKDDEEDEFEESFKKAFNEVITEGNHKDNCKGCDDDVEVIDEACDKEKEQEEESEEELHEEMGADDICPECGCNPCKCKKESCNESKECCNDRAEEDKEKLEKSHLDESNENLGVKKDVAAKEDDLLEQDPDKLAEAPLNEELTEGNNPMMDRLRNKMMAMSSEEHVDESAVEINEDNTSSAVGKLKEDEPEDLDLDDIDNEEESDIDESIKLKETKKHNHRSTIGKLTEEVHEVEVKTENGDVNVQKDGDKVTVDFAPNGGEIAEVEQAAEEMIAPLNDEEINQIENNKAEPIEGEEELFGDEELPLEGEEEIPEDELDIDDFDEESFDEMGESYMRKVYENVDSFLTESVKSENGKLVVEGLITFASGNKKHTTFIFESAQRTKRGKVVLEGMNKTFSNSAKAFNLKGNLINKKFISESMIYNYNVKTLNESNESEIAKVYGRVKRK